MDQFMKTLSFSNITILDDIVYPCMKILDWIDKITFSRHKLSDRDVENISKGAVYIKTCYKLFQEDLPRRIIDQYPFYKLQIEYFFYSTWSKHIKLVDRILQKVYRTKDGSMHSFMMESILNTQHEGETVPSTSISSTTMSSNNCLEISSNRLKLIAIVQRLYQVPKAQVDIAVGQILDYLPFSVIGNIYVEPKNSSYYDSCAILAHKIYERFLNGTINAFFIKSLYVNTSISQSIKQFYWYTLKDEEFSSGIITFFVCMLKELSKKDIDLNVDLELRFYKKHKLEQLFYLLWVTLSLNSPCHIPLIRSIKSEEISTQILCLISTLESIYE